MKEILKEFNIPEDKLNKIKKFKDLFINYNEKINLTSKNNIIEFDLKNIKDSLGIINFFDLSNKKILDLGTGGGFPGIILAILYDNSSFYLLDSSNKKMNWINYVVKELELKNVQTICERVEDLKNLDNFFDIVLSRGVTKTFILVEITTKLVEKNGLLIFYKGKNYLDEQPNEKKIDKYLGLKLFKIDKWFLNDQIERYFISYKKIGNVANNFPRNFSKIKNNNFFK